MPMLSAAFVQKNRILRELDLLAKDYLYPSRLTLLPKEDPEASSSCESPKRISTSFPG